MAAGKGMPPGASQGIVASGPSAVVKGVGGGSGLNGHSATKAPGPCDADNSGCQPRVSVAAAFVLGEVPD